MVHHQLCADRHNQADSLNHHGEREDFQQRFFQPVNIADQLAQAEFFTTSCLVKVLPARLPAPRR